METRLTSAVPHASPGPARIDSAPVGQSVATELAIPQAVAAQAGAENARFGRKRHPDGDGDVPGAIRNRSHVDTDRETGDLVYKVIDPETRSVVTQYPYEALLRLRAYIRTTEGEASKG